MLTFMVAAAATAAFSISEALGQGLGGAGGGLDETIGAIANLIVVVAGPIALWFAGRFIRGHKVREIVYDAGRAAVSETYETYVRALKERAADGRLTEDERREARRIALERMKQIARARGVDVAKEYGDEIARALIEQIVLAYKSKAPRARTA